MGSEQYQTPFARTRSVQPEKIMVDGSVSIPLMRGNSLSLTPPPNTSKPAQDKANDEENCPKTRISAFK